MNTDDELQIEIVSPLPPLPLPRRRSRWSLVWRSFVWLIVVMVLGSVFALPVILFRLASSYEMTYALNESPPDDSQLEDWGRRHAAVESFDVQRRGGELWIRAEYRGFIPRPPQAAIEAQLLTLGYRVGNAEVGNYEVATNLDELNSDPWALGAQLVNLQVALVLVAIFGAYWARRRSQPLPPMFAGSTGPAIVVGVVTGLALVGLGYGYYMLLTAILGHEPPSPWNDVASMSAASKIVLLLLGAIGAPVAEEVFFRGFLFGRFLRSGYVVFGTVFTAFLFAALHIGDPYGVPGIFFIGMVLPWLYYRTRTLVAPIVAHAVNNGIAIVLTLLDLG